MPIKRNSDQNQLSLKEFYVNLSETSANSNLNVGNKMLEFIKMINKVFKETQLWGLTSHSRLIIQAEDSWSSKWYVIIASIGTEDYYFEYSMPKDRQPWENAMVRGEAKSIEEAQNFLLIAMEESEG